MSLEKMEYTIPDVEKIQLEYWLVVFRHPQNISQLGRLLPTYGKIKVMFQTTNQISHQIPLNYHFPMVFLFFLWLSSHMSLLSKPYIHFLGLWRAAGPGHQKVTSHRPTCLVPTLLAINHLWFMDLCARYRQIL